MGEHPLHAVSRLHLDEITGSLGIWQHANGTVPDRASGTCTDDVARALMVDLLHARELGWGAVHTSAWRSLRFLRDAWNPVATRFRNFRDAEGAWLDDTGSADTQGRALLALGTALREPRDPAFTADARMLFSAALPATRHLGAVRPISSCILACTAALEGGALGSVLGGVTTDRLRRLTGQLRDAFGAGETDAGWPWPESVVTYENALLPHALVAGGHRLGDDGAYRLGLQVLDWLLAAQTSPDGSFSPVGNRGWWHRGGQRSRFDQQPIEATATLMACETAFEATSDPRYLDAAECAYGWFLGDNDGHRAVAEPANGGCHDGLGPLGVNANQGAESTLMWLMALEHMRGLRRRASLDPDTQTATAPPAPLAIG